MRLASLSPRLPNAMAIRWNIRSAKPTGATSIPSACARCTMKPSASLRPPPWPITVNGMSIPASSAFSTPTARAQALHDGRVVVAFILQALKNEPLTVQGDGGQTRSLCYVADEIRGFLALMDADYHLPVNIGNPDEVTMLELAHEIRELWWAAKVKSSTPPFRPTIPSSAAPISRWPSGS